MYEGISGHWGRSAVEVTLDQIAQEDRERMQRREQHDRLTRKRHGIKGSRQWGFMSASSGKRGKRS